MDELDYKSTVILSPEDLKLGMYVSYLDRPWTESDFKFQGFEIKTEEELKKLRESCDYVFVHVDRNGNTDDYMDYYHKRGVEKSRGGTTLMQILGQADYEVACTTEEEFPAAREALVELRRAVTGLFKAGHAGQALDLAALRAALKPVADSIERNPDALQFQVRKLRIPDYMLRHSLACAILAASVGRRMGVRRELVEDLAMGGALLDIGKTRFPEELLNRPNKLEATSGELHQLKRHVQFGMEMLDKTPDLSRNVLDMVACHHERHGGNGYPEGLHGLEIPLFGRIAGMVDVFDAMVSSRSYGRRATLYEAARYIRSRKDKDFEPELVGHFHRALGTYPTGSLVELDNGYVGFVIQQAPSAMLTPRIQLVLDQDKNRLNEYRTLDLGEGDLTSAGSVPSVASCLKSGTYGIEY